MALNKNKDLKMFYSISEVASMFKVTETLLRYWEKEFSNIKPQKAGRGIRQYTKADIEQVRLVYHLVKERGMTLQGARDMIKRNKNGEVNRDIEVIERLKSIRKELQAIGRDLNVLDHRHPRKHLRRTSREIHVGIFLGWFAVKQYARFANAASVGNGDDAVSFKFKAQ